MAGFLHYLWMSRFYLVCVHLETTGYIRPITFGSAMSRKGLSSQQSVALALMKLIQPIQPIQPLRLLQLETEPPAIAPGGPPCASDSVRVPALPLVVEVKGVAKKSKTRAKRPRWQVCSKMGKGAAKSRMNSA